MQGLAVSRQQLALPNVQLSTKVDEVTCKHISVIAVMACTGCAPTHQDVMTFLHADQFTTSGTTYRLGPTDSITVISPQAPEVSEQTIIRADGTVHLKLLGEVRVAGLTTHEVASKLQRELRAYYLDPTVYVTLARTSSRVFYLFGEVAGNGGGLDRSAASRPITGRDTVLNVLTKYPPTHNAWLSQIKVIRPGPTPSQNQEMIIDFSRMMVRGDLRKNVLLQEGDILYVPPTPLAWIGYRIQELLQPVAPAIQAYQTPAQIGNAGDVYNQDNGAGSSPDRTLGSLTLP